MTVAGFLGMVRKEGGKEEGMCDIILGETGTNIYSLQVGNQTVVFRAHWERGLAAPLDVLIY